MAKGAVGLTAGYWPEDIYRYLAIPGLSLDEGVVTRPSKRRGDQPALVQGDQALTFKQLNQEVDRTAALLRLALGTGGNRVALAVRSQLDLARLFLGALRARCPVLLLDPWASSDTFAAQLASFQPNLVIGDEVLEPTLVALTQERWTLTTPRVFWQAQPGRTGAPPRLDLKAPSVALVGAGERLVYHSHASLVAWAVSWSAFVPLTEDSSVLTLQPLHRWAGLTVALAALFRGGTCLFTDQLDPPELADVLTQHKPGYLVLSWERARALADEGHAPLKRALRQGVQGVFAALERPFSLAERLRLEAALGVGILTLLGSSVAGPVLASHPTWYIHEAVGIPVTNVDVWPLNPQNRDPLPVPWEAIEFGEVGVRSPLVAADYETPEDRDTWVREEWVRTGVVATMDPNGLFYLRR